MVARMLIGLLVVDGRIVCVRAMAVN